MEKSGYAKGISARPICAPLLILVDNDLDLFDDGAVGLLCDNAVAVAEGSGGGCDGVENLLALNKPAECGVFTVERIGNVVACRVADKELA